MQNKYYIQPEMIEYGRKISEQMSESNVIDAIPASSRLNMQTGGQHYRPSKVLLRDFICRQWERHHIPA
jgi:hypothetical protein